MKRKQINKIRTMNNLKINSEEATAVAAFRVKLGLAKINVTKPSTKHKELERDTTGHLFGEFDITGLPLPVKKHIITAGIIQGEIFEFGDGFASIKENTCDQGASRSGKTLYLYIQALSMRSYAMAVETVETLMNEVLDPHKKTFKRRSPSRSWSKVLQNEYEIQDLMKPILSHLITNGIIKGEIYQSSGAIVNARGSPYLVEDSNQDSSPKRPLYLLIQGPDDKALYWAVHRIKKLIKEAEILIENDTIQSDPVKSQLHTDHPTLPPTSDKLDNVKAIDQGANATIIQEKPFPPPFMPQLGQNVVSDNPVHQLAPEAVKNVAQFDPFSHHKAKPTHSIFGGSHNQSSTMQSSSFTPQTISNNPFGSIPIPTRNKENPPDNPKSIEKFSFALPINTQPMFQKSHNLLTNTRAQVQSAELLEESKNLDNLPPQFSTIREPMENNQRPFGGKKKTPFESQPKNFGRKKRKLLRKMMQKEEANKALESLGSMLVKQGISGEVQYGSSQSLSGNLNRNGTMQLVDLHPPQDVEKVLSRMQQSMPAMQPILFGVPQSITQEERKPVLKPPVLNIEQDLKSEHYQKASTKQTIDGSQPDAFSEVISKLQEYIAATTTDAAKSVPSDGASTSTVSEALELNIPQISADTLEQDSPHAQQVPSTTQQSQESQFSTIIQQLQQYIKSNSQADSQECLEREKLPEDEIKNSLKNSTMEETGSIKENTTDVVKNSESSQARAGSTQWKLDSGTIVDYYKSETQQKSNVSEQKQEFIQRKRSSSEQKSESSLPKLKKIESTQQDMQRKSDMVHEPSSTTATASGSTFEKITPSTSTGFSVSVLGDSMLERARAVWGGSADQDCRKNSHTVSTLTREVVDLLYHGRKLKNHCILMVGVNDVIQSTSHIAFVQDLKRLLNTLNKKGHHVFLVTLPLLVSTCSEINRNVSVVNGFITSFHTKPNVTILPFHKLFINGSDKNKFLKSIHVSGKESVVLSDHACKVIKNLFEEEQKQFNPK